MKSSFFVTLDTKENKKTKYGRIAYALGYLAVLGVFICLAFLGRNQILLQVNRILDFLTGKTGKIYLNYATNSEVSKAFWAVATIAIIIVFVLMTVVLKRRWFVLAASIVIGGAYLCGMISKETGFAVAMLLIIVAFIFCSQYKKGAKAGIRLFPAVLIMVLICTLISLGVSYLCKDLSTENAVSKLKEKIHTYKYECDDNAMPEGKLSDLGPRLQSADIALELMCESFEKLYLRGFTGEKYSGTAWETLDSIKVADSKELFYWLHKEEFFSQTIISNSTEAVGKENSKELTINNVSSCKKYQYLPYGLSSVQSLDSMSIGNYAAVANESKQTIEYFPGSVQQWYDISLKLYENERDDTVQAFLKQEQTYRDFVYENYLQIPNTALGVCERLFTEPVKERSLGEILEEVSGILNSSLEYKENIFTDNGANDFFQYTIEQKKQGYDVHYATSAVLLLRYLGVPSRYVEGYFLSAEEASEYVNSGTVVLNESHAHAWPEIYMDGIGWIPFEVTPGYVDDEKITTVISSASGSVAGELFEDKTYAKSDLIYTPPKDMPKEQETTLPDHLFRSRIKMLLGYWWVLLLLIFMVLGACVFRNRKKLLKTLKIMDEMDNNNAIAHWFAYGVRLMRLAGVEIADGYDEALQLNKEAVFSKHQMTNEQKETVEKFAVSNIDVCKSKLGLLKGFYCHYVLWLFR